MTALLYENVVNEKLVRLNQASHTLTQYDSEEGEEDGNEEEESRRIQKRNIKWGKWG